jgi:hypothetical protein
MKKHAFLVPLAAAVAALVDSGHTAVAADSLPSGASSPEPVNVSQGGVSSSFTVQTSAERVDSFVLARAESGLIFAQHESHSSHASHASHSSHTSSVSLA